MDDDQGGGKLSRRRKSMLRGQIRDAAQSNCRQKQKCKPCASADESGDVSKKQPGHAGDGENDERRNSPATISPTRTPCARQDGERRNDRDKKKNVIQVQHLDLSKGLGVIIERWALSVSFAEAANVQRPTLNVQYRIQIMRITVTDYLD